MIVLPWNPQEFVKIQSAFTLSFISFSILRFNEKRMQALVEPSGFNLKRNYTSWLGSVYISNISPLLAQHVYV